MKPVLALICIALLVPSLAHARPVSYPEGVTLMQKNDMNRNSVHIHYSPTAKYSVGYRGEYWREDGWRFHGVQVNNLIKRWNQPASQANFYLKSGIGIAHSDENGSELGVFTGIAADWEDRRYFTSYENRLYHAGDENQFFMQSARIGIAPYVGDYGDLHTWFMLQVDHQPENRDSITVTPLVRFFRSEYMAEIGVSDNGDALLNLIIRY
jgi:hypothetical protein